MKQKFKYAALILGLLLLLPIAGGFVQYLPTATKVHIIGTEVKRLELTPASGSRAATFEDVRYIQAQDVATGSDIVFRNVDTRWGFPPYFKFDSPEVGAEAQRIARDQPEAIVLVTNYGIRSEVFDFYPNVVGLQIVDADYSHVPVFNIVFFCVLFLLTGVVLLKVRGLKKRRAAKMAEKEAAKTARIGEGTATAASAPAEAEAGAEGADD